MEGSACQKVAKMFKDEGIRVDEVVHDCDSSSINKFRSMFEDVVEQHDINHTVKNLRKKIKKFAKQFDRLRSNAEDWAYKMGKVLSNAIKNCGKKPETFNQLIDNSFLHYRGNHKYCKHDQNKEHEILLLEELEAFKLVFEDYKEDPTKLFSGYTTNHNESLNNIITKYAPKRINFAKNYGWRADLAMLEISKGPAVKLEILEELGLKVSNWTREKVQQRASTRQKRKVQRATEVAKKQRVQRKNKKKQRTAKVADTNNTYKGETGGKKKGRKRLGRRIFSVEEADALEAANSATATGKSESNLKKIGKNLKSKKKKRAEEREEVEEEAATQESPKKKAKPGRKSPKKKSDFGINCCNCVQSHCEGRTCSCKRTKQKCTNCPCPECWNG